METITPRVLGYQQISEIMGRKADVLKLAAGAAPTEAIADSYTRQSEAMRSAATRVYFLADVEDAVSDQGAKAVAAQVNGGVRYYTGLPDVVAANKTANWLERAGFKFQEALVNALKHAR